MLLQDLMASKPNVLLTIEELDEEDGLRHMVSFISLGGRLSDNVPSRMQKVLTELRQLWCWQDVWLLIKDRVYTAAVNSVLLQGSEQGR